MTKVFFTLLTILISFTSINAQQYEFGLQLGMGNYIGDFGQEYYFKHNKIGGGLVAKNTLNPWFSARVNLNYYQLKASDAESESLGRQARDITVEGGILDFSAGIEYNFLPRNPFLRPKSYQRFTPYMFTGIGIASYYGNVYKSKTHLSEYNGASLSIPMILGFKYRLSEHFLFSIETGAQYYFTDNLDGSQFIYDENDSLIQNNLLIPATNPNSNDWYTFTSFTLIYTFGDLRCYFNM